MLHIPEAHSNLQDGEGLNRLNEFMSVNLAKEEAVAGGEADGEADLATGGRSGYWRPMAQEPEVVKNA